MTNKSFCNDITCSNIDIFISIIILISGMSIRRMKQQREEVTSSLQTVGFNLITVNLGVGVSAVAMGVTA